MNLITIKHYVCCLLKVIGEGVLHFPIRSSLLGNEPILPLEDILQPIRQFKLCLLLTKWHCPQECDDGTNVCRFIQNPQPVSAMHRPPHINLMHLTLNANGHLD